MADATHPADSPVDRESAVAEYVQLMSDRDPAELEQLRAQAWGDSAGPHSASEAVASGPLAREHFTAARAAVDAVVAELTALIARYKAADLPAGVKDARLKSLASKIDALRAVRLDADAHPWAGDVPTAG